MTTTGDKIPASANPVYRVSELDRIIIVHTCYSGISKDANAHFVSRERIHAFSRSECRGCVLNGTVRIYTLGDIARRILGMLDVNLKQARCPKLNDALCDRRLHRCERDEKGSNGFSARHLRCNPEALLESKYQALAEVAKSPTFGPHDRQVWFEFAAMYGGPQRPTKATLFVALTEAIHTRNVNRHRQGLPPLVLPSRRTFERFIKAVQGTGAISRPLLRAAPMNKPIYKQRVEAMFRRLGSTRTRFPRDFSAS